MEVKTDQMEYPSVSQNAKLQSKTRHALEATKKWREENDINTICQSSSKLMLLKSVSSLFRGRDNTNHVILLQRPGLIDLPAIHANGILVMRLFHYVYVMEYLLANSLRTPEVDATTTSIIDPTGNNIIVRFGKARDMKRFENVLHSPWMLIFALTQKRCHQCSQMVRLHVYSPLCPCCEKLPRNALAIFQGKKQDEAWDLLSGCDPFDALSDDEPSDMEQDLRACKSRSDGIAGIFGCQRTSSDHFLSSVV
jgi:hypothetical protein